MKLSVIVPVYNIASHLPRCMDSLLGQVYDDWEILLIDDGSDDGLSGPLCDRYAAEHPGLVKAFHLPGGGPGAARNAGLREAAGEYVLFVDGDDYVSPEMMRTLRPFMEEAWDVVIFGFRTDRDGIFQDPPAEKYPYGRTISLSEEPELLLTSPCVWNKLWRADLFRRAGCHFPEGIWYEDFAACAVLLASAERITAIRHVLYYYVVRAGSITHNMNAERNREIITAMEFLTDRYRAKGLYETYREALEGAAVKHVLLMASVRVARIDPDSPVLPELSEYMRSAFPTWSKNIYVRRFPWKHRLLLYLLKGGHYRLVRKLFAVKEGKN